MSTTPPTTPLIIENEADMQRAAAVLAPRLRAGDVVTLSGGLGAGKTAFSRALINHLAAGPVEVPSPTFTLVQVYDMLNPEIWHFDLYRLEDETEILECGWEEARRHGASLVEWPQRLGGLLPRDRLEIIIDLVENAEHKRKLTFVPHGTWRQRWT